MYPPSQPPYGGGQPHGESQFAAPAPQPVPYPHPVPPYPYPPQAHPYYGQGVPGHPYQGTNWLPPVITDPGQWDPNNPRVGLADSGMRFAARAIDTIAFVILWFLMMLLGTFVSLAIGGGDIEGGDIEGGSETVFMVFYIFNFFLLAILVEWLQVVMWGRSIGKMILGLWIVRSDGSGRVSSGRAFLRALLYAPAHTNLVNWFLPWSITNVLWHLRDKERKQCLHDKAARTVVIQVRR